MLNGLDQGNWTRLTHAYGPADDVPELIRKLVSPDAALRRKALRELNGNSAKRVISPKAESGAAVADFVAKRLAVPWC